MKYPFFSNWISYKRIDGDKYCIYDHLLEERSIVNGVDFRIARKLNGRIDPASILPGMNRIELRRYLNYLEYDGLIRRKKVINKSFLSYMKTIKVLQKPSKRWLYWLMNLILMVSFLPIFVIGILAAIGVINITNYSFVSYGWDIYDNTWLIYMINVLILIVSGCIHEICHAISGRAYGAKVMEYGVAITVLPAFYTMIDMKIVRSKLKRIQIMAAGLEGQLLLSGVALLIGEAFPITKVVTYQCVLVNMIMVCINCLPIEGLDGYQITEIALGTDDMASQSKDLLSNRRLLKNVWNEGVYGKAKIGAALLASSGKIIYPILILVNILSWFGG